MGDGALGCQTAVVQLRQFVVVEASADEATGGQLLAERLHAQRQFLSCQLPHFELALNAAEAHDTFEVPLSFLMQPINHRRHSREWNGMVRHFYAIPFADRYIWGVTAGILRNLWERLFS